MLLNRKMPSHPEILPVCLHSLSRHGASSSVRCATRDPKLCSLPLCLVPSSFRNLHHLSLGLFFNCNCSYIACVARTVRFPQKFLTFSSKGAHLGFAQFLCVLSKVPLKFILISTSLRDLKNCP